MNIFFLSQPSTQSVRNNESKNKLLRLIFRNIFFAKKVVSTMISIPIFATYFLKNLVTKLSLFCLVISFFAGSATVYAQSAAELRLQKAELEARIARLQQQIEEEDERLLRFKEQKKIQQQQKIEEIKALNKEVALRQSEVLKARRSVAQVKLKKASLAAGEDSLLLAVEKHARELQNIISYFPFDVKKREGAVAALVFDIEGKRISASEAVNRLLNILDNEIAMSYDSAAIGASLNVDGKRIFGTIFRVGRIYLAFVAEEGVWEFPAAVSKNSPIPRFITPSERAALQRERTVRTVLDMVQGRKPPNFENLPIPVLHLGVEK